MAERFVSNANNEVEFVKKHVAALGSAGGVSYNRDFALSPEERERKVPAVQIPVVQPPEPISHGTASTSAPGTSAGEEGGATKADTITLTVKSLKPPLTFSLPCSRTADIASLKAQLHAANSGQGAPEPERQRWLYKGKAMADERLLSEYDGIKDGETVHLSIKAGAATSSPATSAATPPVAAAAPSTMASSNTEFQAPNPPKDTLAAAPSPFGFQSQPMAASSPTGTSKRRTRTSSQLSSGGGGAHARVPSITLTTDFTNFSNLAGNTSTDADMSATSPTLGTAAATPPFSPSHGQTASGTSTPRSAPGTPYSGGGRGRTPSISVPIDLDNLDLMNPISSDRKLPAGLSPNLVSLIRDPSTWSDLLDFLDSKVEKVAAAAAAAKTATGSDRPPTPSSPRLPHKEHSDEARKVFENWLGASKDWMNASDIARIRDSTGVFGMAGH